MKKEMRELDHPDDYEELPRRRDNGNFDQSEILEFGKMEYLSMEFDIQAE